MTAAQQYIINAIIRTEKGIDDPAVKAEKKALKKAQDLYIKAIESAKTMRSYERAKRWTDDIDKNGGRVYNERQEALKQSRKDSLINHTFPTYKESAGSEANTIATRWAHRKDIEIGDQAAVSFNDNWYVIEKFDDSDLGYQIVDKLTEQEYLTYEEVWNKSNGREQSIQKGVSRFTSLDRQRNSVRKRESNNHFARSQQRGENQEVRGLGEEQTQRGRAQSNRGGDRKSRRSSKQGLKFSLKDSDGNELSPEQQEYFKNSKVVDKDGNLLVVYHQTSLDFTVFDPKKKGAGARDNETPNGIFLKPTKDDIGVKGNKQMKLYANIANPLILSDRGTAKQYWERNIVGYREVIDESAENDTVYGERFEKAFEKTMPSRQEYLKLSEEEKQAYMQRYEELSDSILEEWNSENEKLDKKAKDLIEKYLNENGYDGIHLLEDKGSFGRKVETYIALNPNQVKNTDNLKPTGGSDIRFSLKDSKKDSFPTIDLTGNVELSKRLEGLQGAKKYKAIKNYLIENFGDYVFTLSDGKKAIMDKSDAAELSHKADNARSAQLSNLKNIVEAAVPFLEKDIEHNKFSKMYYYGANVIFKDKPINIVINVGLGINDKKYHIYAITNYKKEAVAKVKTNAPGPSGLPDSDGFFENSITHNTNLSTTFDKKNTKFSLKKSSKKFYTAEQTNNGKDRAKRLR